MLENLTVLLEYIHYTKYLILLEYINLEVLATHLWNNYNMADVISLAKDAFIYSYTCTCYAQNYVGIIS